MHVTPAMFRKWRILETILSKRREIGGSVELCQDFFGRRLSSCLKFKTVLSISLLTFSIEDIFRRVCCHETSRKHPQVMNPHPRSGQRLGLSETIFIDLLGVCSAFCILDGESHGQHDRRDLRIYLIYPWSFLVFKGYLRHETLGIFRAWL